MTEHRTTLRRTVRVMFLIPAFDVGGAERVVARTALRLDRRRFDPVVAAFIRGTGRLLPELENVSAIVLGDERRGMALPWSLLRALRRLRPDVLLTFMFHANIAGRIVGSLAGVPIIVSNERVVGWEPPWRIAMNRATVGLSTALTTNSQAGQQFWASRLGVHPEDIHVLYNGIDLHCFRSESETTPAHSPRLGVLARLHPANGHRWLLDGLCELQTVAPGPWTCEFAGDGPLEADLREHVTRLGLTDRVTLSGYCSDAAAFLRSLDIYVHPSLVSGMPNAVLEAMASGLPVIATAVGGTPEAVQDGETGWLMTLGDAREFATYAARLTENPAMARSMGARGRRRVEERFSLDATVHETEELVDGLARSILHLEYRPELGWATIG